MSSISLIITVIMVAINADTKQCTTGSTCKCTQKEACILKCIGDQACAGSGTELICKSGYPCTIICDSNGNQEACLDTRIDGNFATNITVECTDKFACKTALIHCRNATHCDTTCRGESACEQTDLKCDSSQCSIDCFAGSSNTCKSISVSRNNAVSFNCYNDCSDPGIPDDFSNVTPNPTKSPSGNPTTSPSERPSLSPIKSPTTSPSERPSLSPIKSPIKNPTTSPSERPSLSPTPAPTSISTPPTKNTIPSPTSAPTELPTPTSRPTSSPTVARSTSVPTRTSITANPSITPTISSIKPPTNNPSILSTTNPSSITDTTPPTKSPATAYPTISSSANPTINPSMSSNTVLPTNVPNESHTINHTKLPSVIPSVSSTTKSILTTAEKSVQESNENDINYLGLGMPLWMNAVIGFGIICCLLIVLMLCIRKRKKKSYVIFESPDVNENDQQIAVISDRRETHSNNSIKAEFSMGDLGVSNNNLCEKTLNTFERGLMNNCVVSDVLMEEIVDNMDTRGNIEMSNNNNIVAAQGESMDIQDSIEDINNNINDEQVMLQEIIKMANDTKVTAEGDNNI